MMNLDMSNAQELSNEMVNKSFKSKLSRLSMQKNMGNMPLKASRDHKGQNDYYEHQNPYNNEFTNIHDPYNQIYSMKGNHITEIP